MYVTPVWLAVQLKVALVLVVVVRRSRAGTLAVIVVSAGPTTVQVKSTGRRVDVQARVDRAHEQRVRAGLEAAELGRVLRRRGARAAHCGIADRVERALEGHAGLVAGEGEERRQVDVDLGRRARRRSSCSGAVTSSTVHSQTAGTASTSRCGLSAVISKRVRAGRRCRCASARSASV